MDRPHLYKAFGMETFQLGESLFLTGGGLLCDDLNSLPESHWLIYVAMLK